MFVVVVVVVVLSHLQASPATTNNEISPNDTMNKTEQIRQRRELKEKIEGNSPTSVQK